MDFLLGGNFAAEQPFRRLVPWMCINPGREELSGLQEMVKNFYQQSVQERIAMGCGKKIFYHHPSIFMAMEKSLFNKINYKTK